MSTQSKTIGELVADLQDAEIVRITTPKGKRGLAFRFDRDGLFNVSMEGSDHVSRAGDNYILGISLGDFQVVKKFPEFDHEEVAADG